MSEEEEGSEFGKGIVVCLAKFSEHFGTFWEMQVQNAIRWTKMDDAERAKERGDAARHPYGDAARRMHDVDIILGGFPDWPDEKKISYYITMWMNGASDHFYDLDRDIAPPSLIELADLCLRIGHSFVDETYDESTIKKIRHLWQQACLDVDRELIGIEPDWGSW